MTRAKTAGSADSGVAPLSTDRKAVLICPRCSHVSPVGGDWITVVGDGERDIYCPDCRAYLTTRPRETPGAATAKERSTTDR